MNKKLELFDEKYLRFLLNFNIEDTIANVIEDLENKLDLSDEIKKEFFILGYTFKKPINFYNINIYQI